MKFVSLMWGKCTGQKFSKTEILSFFKFIFVSIVIFFVMEPLSPLSFVDKNLNNRLINKTF